jgi:hypothetical protein
MPYIKEFFDYLPKWMVEDAERAGVPAHIIRPLITAAEEICFKLMILETSYRTGYLNKMTRPEEVYDYLKRITNGIKFGGEE